MLLSKAPDVVRKLREEHSMIFAEGSEDTLTILRDSPQKLGELEYTGAVIKETLRLFPVGFGVRTAKDGYVSPFTYLMLTTGVQTNSNP